MNFGGTHIQAIVSLVERFGTIWGIWGFLGKHLNSHAQEPEKGGTDKKCSEQMKTEGQLGYEKKVAWCLHFLDSKASQLLWSPTPFAHKAAPKVIDPPAFSDLPC